MKFHPVALLCLALAARTGLCKENAQNQDLFGAAATQKIPEAEIHFRQGFAHHSGNGAKQDYALAAACFKKAAELGHAEAQFNLGTYYMNGTGVELDEKEAIKWLAKAAGQGVDKSYHCLGVCHYNLEAYAKAYAWALLAESNGDARLKEMLASMLSGEEIEQGKVLFEKLKKKTSPGKPE